jgi:CRP/FNR family transcriptional regulator, nitrogen oxide reductase regulator
MEVKPADLRRVEVFKDATDDDLELFVENSILRMIEEGGFFFFQGDPAKYFYILVAGKAKLLQSNPAGQQVNLRTITEWQMFGALGAVNPDATYPATAQALESCTALAIESSFLHDAMQTRPFLNMGLMQLMTSYIQEIQERYRELATERVERRIALTVLRLASQIGERVDAEDGMKVELSLSPAGPGGVIRNDHFHRQPGACRVGKARAGRNRPRAGPDPGSAWAGADL